MPRIGARCHELRIQEAHATWRIVYRLDKDCIVIAEIFSKKTPKTPESVIAMCRRRLAIYDEFARGGRS
jgi:phage-related protein